MNTKEKKKLYLQVYDEILAYIKENDLKAGDKLPTEMELCEMFGVSRTIIRESIKSLEITGIIKSRPGVGIEICEINADFFMTSLINNLNSFNDDNADKYVSELRSILEMSLVDEVFQTITDEDLDELKKLIDIMIKESKKQSSKKEKKLGVKFAEADARFHQTMYKHIENKLIKSIIYFSWAYVKGYDVSLSNEQYFDITIDKHIKIYNALKKRDFKMFNSAMAYHFMYFYEEY